MSAFFLLLGSMLLLRTGVNWLVVGGGSVVGRYMAIRAPSRVKDKQT